MKKNNQHADAMRLTTEYTQFLSRQESMIQRLLEQKLVQMEPKIEQMIEQQIKERLEKMAAE